MNILKRLNNNMPDAIKKLFAPLIRHSLVGNKVFLNQYHDILAHWEVAPQFSKLKSLLDYAYQYVPYYKHRWDLEGIHPDDIQSFEDFKRIPVITKTDVRENYEKLLSIEAIPSYDAFTGGTTGQPTKITLSLESIYRERAFIYAFWTRCGYDIKTSKMISFRVGVFSHGRISKYNPLYNEYLLSPYGLNQENFQRYDNIVSRYKPDFISGHSTAILRLCKLYHSNGKKITGIKAVFFASEGITPNDQEFIEDFLGAKTYSFYGHTERSVFAERLHDNYYRFNNNYGYSELLDNGNGESVILCTGYLNRKMPLIRYNTEDSAIDGENGFALIGRRNHQVFLMGKNGERMTEVSIGFTNREFQEVLAFQLIQRVPGEVEFNIHPATPLSDSKRRGIESLVKSKMGAAFDIQFSYEKEMIYTSQGKFRRIIQLVEQEALENMTEAEGEYTKT